MCLAIGTGFYSLLVVVVVVNLIVLFFFLIFSFYETMKLMADMMNALVKLIQFTQQSKQFNNKLAYTEYVEVIITFFFKKQKNDFNNNQMQDSASIPQLTKQATVLKRLVYM